MSQTNPVSVAWEQRESVESLKLSMLKLVNSLNETDQRIKTNVASIQERLDALEKKMEYLNASLLTKQQQQNNA